MKRIQKTLLPFLILFSATSQASLSNSSQPTTFLGPSASFELIGPINTNGAFAVIAQGGSKIGRINGSAGWLLSENQLLKFSAEYLFQKIDFGFAIGNESEWVNQGAVGADYRYILNSRYHPFLDVAATYSHAPSKNLSTIQGFTKIGGITTAYLDQRHIAGSDAYDVSPGIGLVPWFGATTGVMLNYDYVKYQTKWTNHTITNGFGGTFNFSQVLPRGMSLGLLAGIRQPYNVYGANIGWNGLSSKGSFGLGLYGDYVAGKHGLPNTYDVGLSGNYMIDQCATGRLDAKNEGLTSYTMVMQPLDPSLLVWITDPAVHMPQVLAKKDERIVIPAVCTLGPPVLLATPTYPGDGTPPTNPEFQSIGGGPVVFSVAQFFANTANSTYSVSFVLTAEATSDPTTGNFFSIDQTGTVTYTGPGGGQTQGFNGYASYSVTITLTGTGSCGAATTTFSVNIGFAQ